MKIHICVKKNLRERAKPFLVLLEAISLQNDFEYSNCVGVCRERHERDMALFMSGIHETGMSLLCADTLCRLYLRTRQIIL
jgi:hypothetical protein